MHPDPIDLAAARRLIGQALGRSNKGRKLTDEQKAAQVARITKARADYIAAGGKVGRPKGSKNKGAEPEVGEIVKVSSIHGELPGSVDVTIRNGGFIRVALDWEHVDNGELTDAATARIESEVKRKGGFQEVEWKANR